MTPNIDAAERMKVIAARINAGRDSYAGRQDAWHMLGQVFGEFKTWRELLKAAKADFEVVKKQLEFHGRSVPAWGTFRIDDVIQKGLQDRAIPVTSEKTGVTKFMSFMGQVGEGYEVIQHTDGFDLLDRLVDSIDGAHYETMGTLDFGNLIWGQVDPNISINVGNDETKVFLTFHTSHDGSKAFDIFETGVREVCRNTFRLGSLKRLAATLRVKHTKNAHKRIEGLKTEIEEIKNVALTMQEKLTWLSRKRVRKENFLKVMDRVFPKRKDEKGEETESSTRRDNILGEIAGIFEQNDGNAFPDQAGTAYALLNSVTNYVDHSRSTKGDTNGRAISALFGSGETLKQQAYVAIMEESETMDDSFVTPLNASDRDMMKTWGISM